MISGYTDSFGRGQDDVYLIFADANGDTLWTRTIGDSNSQFAKDIIETDEGDFLILGSTGYFSSQGWGNRDVYLIEYDKLGNNNFIKTYGESSYQNWGNAICPAGDGSYLIVGDADITSQDLYQVYALRTLPNESMVWNKRFGEGTNYDYGASVIKFNDENFFICGTTKSSSTGNDIYVLCIDGSGNIIKKQIIKESKSEWAAEGILTDDGKSIVITGHTNSVGAGKFDVLFLKIPIELLTDTDEEELPKQNFKLMQNYPNPFNPTTNIKYSLSAGSNVTLKVFDLLGREVDTLVDEFKTAGEHVVEFTASSLPSGFYFYRLNVGSLTETKKLLLLK